jgi:hypothetical protein
VCTVGAWTNSSDFSAHQRRLRLHAWQPKDQEVVFDHAEPLIRLGQAGAIERPSMDLKALLKHAIQDRPQSPQLGAV